MPIVKYLAKKQISRQLFKVCRLNNFETRSQVESYFWQHKDFTGLKWCGPKDIQELETFIEADLLRLEKSWNISRELLRSRSIIQLVDLLLEKEVFPGNQGEVFKASLRIYSGKPFKSLFELGTEMGISEMRLYKARNCSLKRMLKLLRSLKLLNEDLLGNYELNVASSLIIIDDTLAQRINEKANTKFTGEFLSLLFGTHLESQYTLLGKPVEVLAGNYMGNRHYWSGFYLLKKELSDAMDFEALLQECYQLLHDGSRQKRSFRFSTFISHFLRRSHAGSLEALLPVTAEILRRELGLRVGEDGLQFPQKKGLLFRIYCYEALEAIGEPVPQGVIREQMAEMHPMAFMDPAGFNSVMLEKFGFTHYLQQYYGLRKWYPETKGSLGKQDPEFLEALRDPYSRKTYRAERWQDLMEFVDTHSRLPRYGITAEEDKIRNFWKSQQNRAKKGNYYPEHQQQLDELESRFVLKKYRPVLNWDERYARVKAFTAARGIPPQRAATGEEKVFHNWLRDQRKRMKKGKLDQRQETLIKHYDELYPYKNKKYFERIWDERYKELEHFVQNHSRAPRRLGEEEKIERWYSSQRIQMAGGELNRRQHKLIQGIMDRYPLKDLEYRKVGWHDRCTELEQFAEAHSHLPRYTVEEENALNKWFTSQKLMGIRGKLDAQQLARLQKLSDNFQVPSENERHFYERFSDLKNFIKALSRLPRQPVPEEVSLYTWTWKQLKRAKLGKLKSPQREELLALCAPYQKQKPDWTERFRAVRVFAEAHSRLPTRTQFCKEERILGTWLSGQKVRLNKGRLQQREENLLSYLFNRYSGR